MEEEINFSLSENSLDLPNAFILLMSIRFIDCAKVWMAACSTGMQNSHFSREYFSSPINTDLKSYKMKYSLTHWDHMNTILR